MVLFNSLIVLKVNRFNWFTSTLVEPQASPLFKTNPSAHFKRTVDGAI